MNNKEQIASDKQVYEWVKTGHWNCQQFSKWLETKLRIAHSAGFGEGYRDCEYDTNWNSYKE